MSSTINLALLALISTAAAVPHYAHQRHHRAARHGAGALPAYPTGVNSTALPFVTGSGSPQLPVEPTTTLVNTAYRTETVVSTIYLTKSGAEGVTEPSSLAVADIASGVAPVCGAETVVVTATEQVTVTVPATVPSAAAPVENDSTSVVPEPSSSYVNYNGDASSAAVAEAPVKTSAAVVKASSAAAPVAEASAAAVEAAVSSSAPVASSAKASSAAAASSTSVSSSGSYSGGKRGLAYNDVSLISSFGGASFGFAYNWAQSESTSLPDGIQFIPMMHKTSDSTAEAFLANVDAAVAKGTTAVMGFNEPDQSEQANMSPDAACTAWASYLQPIITSHPDVSVLSPSVTNGAAPMGLDWLSRFQTACPSATWHAANIHFYDVYDDQTFDRFKAHVELAIDTFKKPLWITEFGLNPGSATAAQAASFLKQAVAYLDGNASVQGYAWFMVGTDTSFNMLNSGTGLSTTGEIYASS